VLITCADEAKGVKLSTIKPFALQLALLQDGVLCLHSLFNWNLLCTSTLSDADAVAAVVFHPAVHRSSSSSSSSGYSLVLFAAAGRELQQLVVTIPAVWQTQQNTSNPAAAAAAAAAAASASCLPNGTPAAEQQQQQVELQVVARQVVSLDDISALAVNHQGTYLAAADDTGGEHCECQTLGPAWNVKFLNP
jgi:hypothetical protein